jgi:O-antigen/teichoic acid export membrane protein
VGFFRNVASVFATTAIGLPVSVASNVILAHWLSVSDRGLYAVLTTFSVMFYLFTQLGWGEAVIYRTRRFGIPARRAFATGLLANLGVLAVTFSACVLARAPLSRWLLGDVSATAFYLAAAAGPLLTLGDFMRGVARAVDRFDLHNQYLLGQSFGILAGLFVALRGGGSLEAALGVNFAVQLALVLGFGVRVGALVGFEWRLDLAEARSSLAYASSLWIQNILINYHERLPLILLSALGVASSQIAFYAVGQSVVSPLQLIPGALGTVLLPRLSEASEGEAGDFIAGVVRLAAWVMLGGALALAVVGTVAIPLLFGREYQAAVTPFLLLLPGLTLVTVSRLLARYFSAVGRPQALVGVIFAATALNAALNFFLIPRFGVLGAAGASLLSYSFEAVASVAMFVAASGQSLRATLLPSVADVAPHWARVRALVAQRLR